MSYQIQTCLLRTSVILSRRAAMSIKGFHFSGVSKELAVAVGPYEAAELSLGDIDTSILDDTRGDAMGMAPWHGDAIKPPRTRTSSKLLYDDRVIVGGLD